MKRRLYNAVSIILLRSVRLAPIILAGGSAFCLFLIIVPFFLLGIHHVPADSLDYEHTRYDQAMGSVGAFIAIWPFWFLQMSAPFLWLLAFADFVLSRRWWVLAVLALAPLPLAYYSAGPYSGAMFEWLTPG